MCSRKWQEKNIASKKRMAGLEGSACLLAPLLWDGQGETNIFRESMGRLSSGFNPMPLGKGIHLVQECVKMELSRQSVMPSVQMLGREFIAARW
jgi:hypothetical protein